MLTRLWMRPLATRLCLRRITPRQTLFCQSAGGGLLRPSPRVCCTAQNVDNVSKEDYLALEDDELWQQCKMETYRASGPGGQHRNKVDSAVRVIHKPTGTVASATGKGKYNHFSL